MGVGGRAGSAAGARPEGAERGSHGRALPQILDAVSLEERFKATIPLLVRQIEGLKLLQKTRKHKPDEDKRASTPPALISGLPAVLLRHQTPCSGKEGKGGWVGGRG